MRTSSPSFLVLNLCLALLTVQAASAQRYTVTDLGALPGPTFPSSTGNGINRSGQVTGSSNVAGSCSPVCTHAFLYSQGNMLDLGTLPGGSTSAGNGINNGRPGTRWEEDQGRERGKHAQVVGYSETTGGNFHAFLYSHHFMRDLGTLPGGSSSTANAISSSGEVTGNSDTANASFHAFLYSNGMMHDLGTLPGGTFSGGNGINQVRREGVAVVGIADVPGDCTSHLSCPYHAFLYKYGVMQDLGTLPGGFFSYATGINQSGQVTGSADTNLGNFHAFLYDNGTMRDLGTLPGTPPCCFQSFAQSINKFGQIVGYTSVGNINDYHAFVYSKGMMRDLNGLIPPNSGWFLGFANGINDRGEITGSGIINQEGHAFLLTPACSHDRDQDIDDGECDGTQSW
jgi:probable HAF family extracellular repeat protein